MIWLKVSLRGSRMAKPDCKTGTPYLHVRMALYSLEVSLNVTGVEYSMTFRFASGPVSQQTSAKTIASGMLVPVTDL